MRTVDAPTSPTSVYNLLSIAGLIRGTIALQAPIGNVDNIFFGDEGGQPFFIQPGNDVLLPESHATSVFLLGSAGDTVTVGVFQV